jgi:toxin ParE1/3/4
VKVRVSRAAARDLEEIYTYTLERWGVQQADEYLRSFQGAFLKLASTPKLGVVTDIREGYRKFRHREHLVFYQILQSRLEVRRVLHPRMDVSQHLS